MERVNGKRMKVEPVYCKIIVVGAAHHKLTEMKLVNYELIWIE